MTRIIVRGVSVRKDYLEYLFKRLPRHTEYIVDVEGGMSSFLRQLEVAGNDPAVLMEDDCFVVKDFGEKLERAISKHPDTLIQFYSQRQKDLTVGSRFEPGSNYSCAPCTYFPAGMCREIYEYYGTWRGRDMGWAWAIANDTLVADYLKSKKLKYWIEIPNLVESRYHKSVISPTHTQYRQRVTTIPRHELAR